MTSTTSTVSDPLDLMRPRRKIAGASAILLPFTEHGRIDWPGLEVHVARTADAGLMPAVNMDAGYVNLLEDETRIEVLTRTRDTLGSSPFVAGAFVQDAPGDGWAPARYLRQIDVIQQHGGIPIIFQSYGLVEQTHEDLLASYAEPAAYSPRFIGKGRPAGRAGLRIIREVRLGGRS